MTDSRQTPDSIRTQRQESGERNPADLGRGSSINDPLVGRRIGDYEIRRVLGRGGMGSVYEAFHLNLHKTVAVKVLASHLLDDARAIERFRREMRAIGRLNSPYVVQAFDASLSGEIQYIAMEYVDGIDADELVRRLHAVPVEDACEVVRQAALGLEDAHQEHLVHRDIKPKNVAISKTGKVKILDLGLALCKSEVMATGRLTAQAAIGSYQYMAPEQFDDSHEVDIRADIYSLGCTLYHLLAGRPPFSGPEYRTLTSLMEAHRSVPPPPIAEFNGRVPVELSAVLDRALAKKPEERFSTPAEMGEAVAGFAKGHRLAKLVAVARESEAGTQTYVATSDGSPTTDPSQVEPPRWQATPSTGERRRRLHVRTRWLALGAIVAGVLIALVATREWESRGSRADRVQIAEFALLAPGLNGNWWLDETPWLSPPVRATLAEALSPASAGIRVPLKGSPTISATDARSLVQARTGIDVAALQLKLNALSGRLVTAGSRTAQDAFFSFQRDDPESMDDKKLGEKLERIAGRIQASSESSPSPVDLHLIAVAAHKQANWKEAGETYERSLDAYEHLTPTPALAALCHADYGELLFARGEFDDAAVRFRTAAAKVAGRESAFPEFLVYATCREADSLRKLSDSIGQARGVLEHAASEAERLPPDHPLRAFLAERQAWLALDEWRAEDAAAQFEKAIRARQKSADLHDRRAEFFIFFDQQGLAMSERLRGRDAEAREYLDNLAKSLAEALADERKYSAKQRSQLRSRYLNTLERSADSDLFGPGEPSDAKGVLAAALDFAKRNIEDDGPLARHLDRVRCKWLIACAAADDDVAAELPTVADKPSDTLLETRYRKLARAAVGIGKRDPDAAKAIVDLVLAQKAEEAGRDEIEFCFLACKLLYRHAPADDPAVDKAVDKAISHEARLARSIERRSHDSSTPLYLRPHYDTLIRRAAESNTFPRQDLATIVLESTRPSLVNPPEEYLAFYFGPDWGLAVDARPKESPKVHQLDFGANQLRQSRQNESLRSELVQKLPAEIQARRAMLDPKAVFWTDPVRGVTEVDYPTHPTDG